MLSHSSIRYRSTSFREGGRARLRGVDIFSAGTHRGKTYAPRDLDDMVRNFERSSTGKKPGFSVPAVLGHEETQEYLERSDLPAAGWVKRVWRDGSKLKADFDDVPPKVARLLKGKTYRTVSAEVYDEPPEGVPGQGKMLRRVAFLGGDIPQLKSLADIPEPEVHCEFAPFTPCVLKFSEIKARPSAGAWVCFSEVVPMDRDAMIAELAKHGVDTSTLEQVPDPALAEMLRVCEAKDQQGQGDESYDENENMPEPKDDAEKAQYAERARKMSERAKRYMERYCSEDMQKMDDEPMPEPVEGTMPAQPMGEGTMMPKKVTTTHQYNEAQIADIVRSEVRAALKSEVQGSVGELEKFRDETVATEKKRAVESFCERMRDEGRLCPAEYDAAKARLLRADSRQVVQKFREKGKDVAKTELDLQMDEIRSQSTIFRELMKHPTKGGVDSEDAEVLKVEQHFEVYREHFRPTGTTKEGLVTGFKAARKHDPELTADSFLGK